tara:strand:- start:1225 stop:2679 length:1455 start_codon:yes stop_codon:yes gene_type:complete
MIEKHKLIKLLEPHFEKYLVEDSYEVKTIKAKKLLTCTRFDIAFKLLYLEMLGRNVLFAKDFYKEQIRAFSLGRFTEPGNEEKNSIEKFFEEFDKTFEDINTNGFDSSRSLVPLSKNGSIANGAHRIASALYLDKQVECVHLDMGNHVYDYKFFYNRNVSGSILDAVATKFVEYADNLHIAFIWPTAKGHDEEIEKIIPNIVYRKDVSLNPNGAHNLLSQIYYGEEWLGSEDDNFRGSQAKLIECFQSFEAVKVIAFQAESLDEVLTIKDKVRDVFNIGKHSIHITDTKEEAIRVARVVFNDNSIHFLNNAKPNKYISTHQKIDKFKSFVKANDLDFKDILIDSSLVLSCYGLREARDVDYICDGCFISKKFKGIDCHDEELSYHDNTKQELIYNPCNYFYFNDIKFISFFKLFKMKTNRLETKDQNDLRMMSALLKGSKVRELLASLSQNIFYWRLKFKSHVILFLKKTGLYDLVRYIFRTIT